MTNFIALIALLAGCSGGGSDTDVESVDYRLDPTAVDAPPAGGLQWVGPDVEVPPYSEMQYCQFQTYTGPDVGLNSFQSYQGDGAHHLIILGTSAGTDQYADGETIDCTKTADIPMTDFEPLINAEPTGAGSSAILLPEGMAVKLRSGQRYVVQAHYVNTSGETRRYQDLMNLGLIAEESVSTWAAAFALTSVDFELPAQQETTVTFDCSFEDTYNLLYVTGHMHELGKSFVLDHASDAGTEELFAIPVWDVGFRDLPPVQKYAAGELEIPAADVLRTACTWQNDSDLPIEFPEEMCATYGMLYPSLTPVVCTP